MENYRQVRTCLPPYTATVAVLQPVSLGCTISGSRSNSLWEDNIRCARCLHRAQCFYHGRRSTTRMGPSVLIQGLLDCMHSECSIVPLRLIDWWLCEGFAYANGKARQSSLAACDHTFTSKNPTNKMANQEPWEVLAHAASAAQT